VRSAYGWRRPRRQRCSTALGLGLRGPATERALDEIAAFLSGVGWCVELAPQAEPPELRPWLASRGFAPGYGWTKFVRGVHELPRPRTKLRVERVGRDLADAFAEAFVRRAGLEPQYVRANYLSSPEADTSRTST
jgi:hypothetical protein